MRSCVASPWRSPWMSAALLYVALLCPPPSRAAVPDLRGLPDVVSVTVFEQTEVLTSHVFALGAETDPRLLAVIPGGPTEAHRDFTGARDEYYDVYLSDASGNLDTHGGYVSIVCDFEPASDIGNNIDAIALNFNEKPSVYAGEVGSVQTSSGLTDPYLCHAGFVLRVLGPPDANSTRLSQGGLSRLTAGFGSGAASRALTAALLRMAGGLQVSAPDDAQRGDLIVGGGCGITLDLLDAVAAARLAAGLPEPVGSSQRRRQRASNR